MSLKDQTVNQWKLLIVDDESEICRFLCEIFTERDFQVYTAQTKADALDAINQFQPHLILLDVRLTKSGSTIYEGIEILKEVKSSNPKIKIIMVTAVEDQNTIQKALSLGADNYITKPLELSYLETSVMKMIQELLSKDSVP